MDIGLLKGNEKIEAWFPFEDGASILIAYSTPEDLGAIIEESTTIEIVKGQEIEKQNDILMDELFVLKTVKNWKGFTDSGQPFPFNEENVKLLANKYTGFRRFVREKSLSLSDFIHKKKEATKKKSQDISGLN